VRHGRTAGAWVAALAAAGWTALPPAAAPACPTPLPVVVVSIDGLRPAAIDAFHLATLQRLAAEGSHALSASTVLPSTTLPSHASMLTGVTPSVHGIRWNSRVRGADTLAVPTVFELVRARGHEVAAFYGKAKLRHLDRPAAYDRRLAPAMNLDKWLSADVLPEAIAYLRSRRPVLLFVHFADPDYAGHAMGWMSEAYGLAARRADAALGRLLAEAEAVFGVGGFRLLVTSDHGGRGRGHGTDHPLDVRIPWIAYGAGVSPGGIVTGVRTMDTAATILWLLDVPIPAEWEGRPVVNAFGVAPGAPLPTRTCPAHVDVDERTADPVGPVETGASGKLGEPPLDAFNGPEDDAGVLDVASAIPVQVGDVPVAFVIDPHVRSVAELVPTE
jgi:hypothetical protein